MSSGSSASYHCEKKGAARLDEEKTSSRRHGEPKSASPYPTASTKRRLDSEDVGQQPGPSSLRTPEHDEDEEMPEDELLETRIVPIVSKRSTRSQKLREDVASERTKSPSTPHQVAQNLIDKYKNNRKIGHVKKGERCSICLRCSGIHCGKMHSNVQKKVESDLQRLLPDGEEIEVIFIEKVLRYLKGRYQYEEGNLKDVYIRHMIIEGHKLNLYNSQEKERKFEEEEARFEKTIVPASLLKALKKVMEKIKGDRNPLEDCIARKVSFCMYCNREKEPTCNDGHRLTLGQFAINEVERNHNGDWRSVENVIAKLKDQELIYMSNLVEFRNSLKRESERRPKQVINLFSLSNEGTF
ncbi:hypothetical protein B9Z55_023877 [Caenorhabditis nigoni]|uniref:Uncharacterized protein n=1 Tax=Caenorhabditis nigoni TaxID=1611254 RepID=A0A2G5SS12_9PELO|nr:hypothetical protein B9Z55_023877 [Caenorhabditis nigoni]